MLRRLVNTVVENIIVTQPEPPVCQTVLTKPETTNLNWLCQVAPCFPVSVKQIRVLTEPCQFYNAIVTGCKEAKDRITLVSLYLGNGELERRIVDSIIKNDNFCDGSLQVTVLLDFTRGSRLKDNSRTMLKPLLEKNDKSCEVSLYHTPALRGLVKRLMPNRWNELLGLQHMKLYIFDDTLIISGANLSNDYFTNRQDRYYMIKDKQLTDFYCGLVKQVQGFSLRMDKNNNVSMNSDWKHLPYEGSKGGFVRKAGDSIRNFISEAKERQNAKDAGEADTWIFPLVQMGQLGVYQDAYVTERLLSEAPAGSQLYISTGYFNLTHKYMKTILYESHADCRLLMAHPDANGFKGAKGAAGGIPAAYCLLADSFREKVEKLGQRKRITFQEYLKPGWTFHAKGLWYYPPQNDLPCVTFVGSPNFGERSVKRDLETQLAIVTENRDLQLKMHNECRRLYDKAVSVENRREIPPWVYAMVTLFRGYF